MDSSDRSQSWWLAAGGGGGGGGGSLASVGAGAGEVFFCFLIFATAMRHLSECKITVKVESIATHTVEHTAKTAC
jgi:hypothetical protein